MKTLQRKCQRCGHPYRRHFALGGPCVVKVRGKFLGSRGRGHRYSHTRCECPKFEEATS